MLDKYIYLTGSMTKLLNISRSNGRWWWSPFIQALSPTTWTCTDDRLRYPGGLSLPSLESRVANIVLPSYFYKYVRRKCWVTIDRSGVSVQVTLFFLCVYECTNVGHETAWSCRCIIVVCCSRAVSRQISIVCCVDTSKITIFFGWINILSYYYYCFVWLLFTVIFFYCFYLLLRPPIIIILVCCILLNFLAWIPRICNFYLIKYSKMSYFHNLLIQLYSTFIYRINNFKYCK